MAITGDDNEEKFSDNPEENLNIENEFLKIKLKAQYGENFQMFGDGEALPPEIENQFLKNIINFENQLENIDLITIKERLGNISFAILNTDNQSVYKEKVEEIISILKNNSIDLIIENEHPNYEEVYHFLITDFMELEIEAKPFEGMVTNFVYEEFRPNFELEIRQILEDAQHAWEETDIDYFEGMIHQECFLHNGKTIDKETVLAKIKLFFDAFKRFEDSIIEVEHTTIQHKNIEDGAPVQVTGRMQYAAILDNEEKINYAGNFTFGLIRFSYYWVINQLLIPGFKL